MVQKSLKSSTCQVYLMGIMNLVSVALKFAVMARLGLSAGDAVEVAFAGMPSIDLIAQYAAVILGKVAFVSKE